MKIFGKANGIPVHLNGKTFLTGKGSNAGSNPALGTMVRPLYTTVINP